MKIFSQVIKIKTKAYLEVIDVTEKVQKFIQKSRLKDGIILVYSKHTTMNIRINEQEKGIFQDFKDLVNRLVPKEVYYRHNDLSIRTENLVCTPGASDCLNGYSHCLHFLMGNSETIPVSEGKLVLGSFQRIFAVELDCARDREIFLQLMGR